MADISILAPIIAQWEGHYVNNPNDKGGPTNMGITLGTWQTVGYDKNHDGHIDIEDIKILSSEDFQYVLRKYWDSWKADNIVYQSVANILVDWVWGSGVWGIKIPQRILKVDDDGKVGNKTLTALNNYDQKILFTLIKEARIKFVEDLCNNHPDQNIFKKGWINRINSFKF